MKLPQKGPLLQPPASESESASDALYNDMEVPLQESEKSIRSTWLRDKALMALEFNFSTECNTSYFKQQHVNNRGNAYLVSLSQFHVDNAANRVTKKEVSLHISVAALTLTLTVGQRVKFAEILQQVYDMGANQTMSTSGQWSTSIPRSFNMLRSMYVRGKYAMLQNLPRPPVSNVDGHAYISLRDCVADLLAFGLEIEKLDCCASVKVESKCGIHHLSETPRCQKIWENAVALHSTEDILCLYITEWSDDFEPSTSIRGGNALAWVKTIMICPPHGNSHALTHMYPIAIGEKGDSHEAVERHFAEELLSLSSGKDCVFYHGALKLDAHLQYTQSHNTVSPCSR